MERYFIYDALGRKQGNPKGYKTYKGAQTQVDNKLYCLLEEKIDSVLADKPAKKETPAVKQSL